jgi:hypothetical protein
MNQDLGTWQATVNKDTVLVWETVQYGKSFVTNESLLIRVKNLLPILIILVLIQMLASSWVLYFGTMEVIQHGQDHGLVKRS